MPLEWVRYKNFQKHKKRDLWLSPGVNVIVGDTEAGKSSLLRGIVWLMLGGPAGGYATWGESECRVSACFDGVRVVRSRSKQGNLYRCGGKEYAAVGVNVPPDVAAVMNVCPLNVRRQMDPPFLITTSPPEAARTLDKVVSLDQIDAVLSRLDSQVRQARREAESTATALASHRTAFDALEWVPTATATLDALEAKQTRLQAMRQESDARSTAAAHIRQSVTTLRDVPDVSGMRVKVEKLAGLRRRAYLAVQAAEDVRREGAEVCRLEAKAKQSKAELEASQSSCPLCGRPAVR